MEMLLFIACSRKLGDPSSHDGDPQLIGDLHRSFFPEYEPNTKTASYLTLSAFLRDPAG
jgi:hypothetical protein